MDIAKYKMQNKYCQNTKYLSCGYYQNTKYILNIKKYLPK